MYYYYITTYRYTLYIYTNIVRFVTNDSYVTVELDVVVRICDCGGNRGICDFGNPLVGYNKTDRYQVASCDCKRAYEG